MSLKTAIGVLVLALPLALFGCGNHQSENQSGGMNKQAPAAAGNEAPGMKNGQGSSSQENGGAAQGTQPESSAPGEGSGAGTTAPGGNGTSSPDTHSAP